MKSLAPGKIIQAATSTPQSTIDPAVLAQLACPACHGDLRLEDSGAEDSRVEDSRLICNACARTYPVTEGIPALIIERAESADNTR